MLSPSAQEIRPSGSGCGSIQGGEVAGVIYETLNTASLWELKNRKIDQCCRMCSEYISREKKHQPLSRSEGPR